MLPCLTLHVRCASGFTNVPLRGCASLHAVRARQAPALSTTVRWFRVRSGGMQGKLQQSGQAQTQAHPVHLCPMQRNTCCKALYVILASRVIELD